MSDALRKDILRRLWGLIGNASNVGVYQGGGFDGWAEHLRGVMRDSAGIGASFGPDLHKHISRAHDAMMAVAQVTRFGGQATPAALAKLDAAGAAIEELLK